MMFKLNFPSKFICGIALVASIGSTSHASEAQTTIFDTFHACIAAYRGAKTAGQYLESKGYQYNKRGKFYVKSLPSSKQRAELVVHMNPKIRGEQRYGCLIQTYAGGEFFDLLNSELTRAFRANKIEHSQAGYGTYAFRYVAGLDSIGMKVTGGSPPLTTMDLSRK